MNAASKQIATKSNRSEAARRGWETRRRNAALRALLASLATAPAANEGNPELPEGWDVSAEVLEVGNEDIIPLVPSVRTSPPPLPATYHLEDGEYELFDAAPIGEWMPPSRFGTVSRRTA